MYRGGSPNILITLLCDVPFRYCTGALVLSLSTDSFFTGCSTLDVRSFIPISAYRTVINDIGTTKNTKLDMMNTWCTPRPFTVHALVVCPPASSYTMPNCIA